MQETEQTPAPQKASHYALPTKKNTSVRNMVWALGLTMLIVVGVGVGFFGVGSDHSREPLPNSELDVAASAKRAQQSAPYPVAVPSVGASWEERSARYAADQQRWEVRYTSPSGQLVSLVQAPEVSAPLLASTLPGATVTEQRTVQGVTCDLLSGGSGEKKMTGLSCEGDGWGLLVHGQADAAELEDLAGAAITSIL